MKENNFPPGWDEERVRRVLAHYEEQTEAEAAAEDEKQQKAIRTVGPRNAGRREDEARRLSPLELLASWEPLDEDFPKLEDPPPLDEGDL